MPKIPKFTKKELFLIAVGLILITFAFSKPGRTIYKVIHITARLNPSTSSFSASPDIKSAQIFYDDDGKQTPAVIFRKGTQKQSAVIISAGVGLTDYNYKLIDSFASSLADVGITVMIPQTQSMKDDIVNESSIRSYVNAFRYLENQGSVDKKKIGYFGFCAGASFLALAAEDPDIANRVAFLALFSPYNNFVDYLAQTFSRQALTKDGTRNWQPHPQTVELLQKNLMFRTNLLIAGSPNKAEISQKVNDIFTKQENAASKKSAIENLSSKEMLSEAALLSPDHAAKNIKAKTYIFHDYNDTFTPREESERLKAEIPGAELIEPTIFDHTIFRKDISRMAWATQGTKVLIYFYKILYHVS